MTIVADVEGIVPVVKVITPPLLTPLILTVGFVPAPLPAAIVGVVPPSVSCPPSFDALLFF